MVRPLVVLIATASMATASASAAQPPSLTIQRSTPLVVRGLGFHAREIVTVTTPVGRLRVRSTATGGFLARFSAGGDRCTGGRVVAVGASGDRVVMRLPQTMCAPAAAQSTPG